MTTVGWISTAVFLLGIATNAVLLIVSVPPIVRAFNDGGRQGLLEWQDRPRTKRLGTAILVCLVVTFVAGWISLDNS